MDAELEASIENLYSVFGQYPLRPSTEPCLHCHEPDVELVLHERPLREISPDDLGPFAAEALMVWGIDVDFKHFLPRMLEIASTEDGSGWPGTGSLFARLSYGRWHEWPEHEQHAVQDFLRAFWRSRLSTYPAIEDIASTLSAIAATDIDIQPFLDSWLEQPGEAPLRHLADFAWIEAPIVMTKGRSSNWPAARRPAGDALRSWLRGGRPGERLLAGFFDASNGEIEAQLSAAVSVLEALELLPGPR